jgi:hypothetical protein
MLSGFGTSFVSMTPPTYRSLAARIAAAAFAHPILRRALVSALYAEMLRAPDAIGTAADWRALSRVLLDCEIELYGRPHMVPPEAGDILRALEFSALSRDAHNRGVMMRLRVERAALRSGRRVPRVIDATCTEVQS